MTNENGTTVTIKISGRIDSGNAQQTEQSIQAQLDGKNATAVILDAADLEYISSAGLRVILRLKKAYADLRIINLCPEVYEIFDMTGFTEMMRVEKAYRVVSVEGCEVIGEGANGKVYRIDRDNVVKTYKNADALSEIRHEREVAKLALILGVPTAISYDVVRVGDSYGSVFELLNAHSFSKILAQEPERFDFCVTEYVQMLHKIHSITVPDGKLPFAGQRILDAIRRIKASLPDGLGEKLERMTLEIPERHTMVHGDCHTKNIVLAGEEVLLIDMDTLSYGHPIFEFVPMYNAYIGFSEYDPEVVHAFQGFSAETARKFWHASLKAYLCTGDEQEVCAVEEKIRCLSYAYLIDRSYRHAEAADAKGIATLELWKSRLIDLLRHVDSLVFDVDCEPEAEANELTIEATTDNLDTVIDFVNERLERSGCSVKAQMQMDLAVEEIFVNIANYAYAPNKGNATVRVEVSGDPVSVTITFMDQGVPYDPLKKDDPDITLSANDRQIGGLGIFLTKKVMDDVSYSYKNGQNVLTLKKQL